MSDRLAPIAEADYLAVVNYLQAHARGAKNAKRRKELEPLVHVHVSAADRVIRKIGSLANERGVPVATGNNGYFIALSYEEFEDGLSRMKSQRDEMHKRIMRVERLRATLFQPPFTTLHSDLEAV